MLICKVCVCDWKEFGLIHTDRVISLGQMVALEMVNKCVKFHDLSFNNVETIINFKKSLSGKEHNFVIYIQNWVMYLCQIVALMFVNKCVKFHNISLNIVEAMIKI